MSLFIYIIDALVVLLAIELTYRLTRPSEWTKSLRILKKHKRYAIKHDVVIITASQIRVDKTGIGNKG